MYSSKSHQGREVVGLPRCHIAATLTAAPSILTAGRTVVLPSEGPELRCDHARIRAGLVSRFFAASDVAAAALIRIWRFIHP